MAGGKGRNVRNVCQISTMVGRRREREKEVERRVSQQLGVCDVLTWEAFGSHTKDIAFVVVLSEGSNRATDGDRSRGQ